MDEKYSKGAVDRAGRTLASRVVELGGDRRALLAVLDSDDVSDELAPVRWWRERHSRPLSSVAAELHNQAGELAESVGGEVLVAQRLKRVPTVVDKLVRFPEMKLTQMTDIGGARTTVPDLGAVAQLRSQLEEVWAEAIHEVRDYIASPRESGYRAVHFRLRRKGVRIEVQVRTTLQDRWANRVENLGNADGIDYKSERGSAVVLEHMKVQAEVISYLDRGETLPQELIDRLEAARLPAVEPGDNSM